MSVSSFILGLSIFTFIISSKVNVLLIKQFVIYLIIVFFFSIHSPGIVLSTDRKTTSFFFRSTFYYCRFCLALNSPFCKQSIALLTMTHKTDVEESVGS